jgi:hypothetical protein
MSHQRLPQRTEVKLSSGSRRVMCKLPSENARAIRRAFLLDLAHSTPFISMYVILFLWAIGVLK